MKKFDIGDYVKCIDMDGVPEEFKLKVGRKYKIRDIGERTGGLRFEGIQLYRDLTGYEKCYSINHFMKV